MFCRRTPLCECNIVWLAGIILNTLSCCRFYIENLVSKERFTYQGCKGCNSKKMFEFWTYKIPGNIFLWARKIKKKERIDFNNIITFACHLFRLFKAKNPYKWFFRASKGVNFSNFVKIAPNHGGCSPTTLKIFGNHFVIINSNPARQQLHYFLITMLWCIVALHMSGLAKIGKS